MTSEYALTPTRSSCPLCLSEDAALLYRVDSRQAAQHFVLEEVNRQDFTALRLHIEDLWRGRECQVLRCSSCSFVYADPYVAGDTRFYSLAYKREGYPLSKWEYEVTYPVIEKKLKSENPGRVALLEIGAGNGAFVKRLSPRLIPKANILCTEYSDYGISKIRSYGVTCLRAGPLDIPLSEYAGSFDFVCLFQILEHLTDLDALFAHLAGLAKPFADMFVGVPNDRRIAFNETHEALLDMPPNHIGRWNEHCFEAIVARHGWEVVQHRTQPGSLLAVVRDFSNYRYRRSMQRSGAITNQIERIRSPIVRKCFKATAVAAFAFNSMPLILRSNLAQLGDVQWFHASLRNDR